jgi:hypothetical protein
MTKEMVMCSQCRNTREVLTDKLTQEDFCSGCGNTVSSSDIIFEK